MENIAIVLVIAFAVVVIASLILFYAKKKPSTSPIKDKPPDKIVPDQKKEKVDITN